MKIYLATKVSYNDLLTRVGSKRRLYSFFHLKDAKWGIDELALYKETGRGHGKDDYTEGDDKWEKTVIDQPWEEDIKEKMLPIACKIGHAFDSIYNKDSSKNRHKMEIGRLLIEAKKILKHGEYKPWIEKTLPQYGLSRSASYNYRDIYSALIGYNKIIDYLPFKFLNFLTYADTFSANILELIDSNAKFLQWADLDKVMGDHKNKIESYNFKQAIEHQIEMGKIRFHNKDIPGVRKGTLTITKLKDILDRFDQTLKRLDKYSFDDDGVTETFTILDQMEEIVSKLNKLAETKSYFSYIPSEEELAKHRKKRK